jgi:hypothetical protein
MPLCHYLHGNDSGWDNSTMFDEGGPLRDPAHTWGANSFLCMARLL